MASYIVCMPKSVALCLQNVLIRPELLFAVQHSLPLLEVTACSRNLTQTQAQPSASAQQAAPIAHNASCSGRVTPSALPDAASSSNLLGRGLLLGGSCLRNSARSLLRGSRAQDGRRHAGHGGGSSSHHSWRSGRGSSVPPHTGAAAAAAAVAALLGGLSSSVLAEASPEQSPIVAAQVAVGTAWEAVSQDLQRLNAALPRRALPLVGRPPKVSALGADGVEVVVPLREGADANAVLAELVDGFSSRKAGAGSRSSSMQTHSTGATRTVHLDVHESGGGGGGGKGGGGSSHVTARLHVPAPGSSEHGSLVVTKRGAQGFTQQELASLAQLVRTANLSFAPQRKGSLNQGPFGGEPFYQDGGVGGSFDDLLREMGAMLGFAGSMHSITQQLISEMAEAMEQQGVFEEGEDAEGSEWPGSVHADFPPKRRSQAAGPDRINMGAEAEGGHDWGSPKAAQAVKQLQSMGVQVYPPRRKDTMDWGGLAGYDEQKRMIEDCLLLPLLRPDVYEGLTKATRKSPTSNRPRAVLFEGPPGTGKTTSARVISSQASVPLVYVPLEAVMSKWFGESEGLLAKVFKSAEALGGAIIFIDELDSLGGSRERGDMHEASRRLLSVLLREMDGFDAAGKRAVVIGATNRKVDLDPALMSRFDLSIPFGMPDEVCRALILKQYAQQLSQQELQQLAAAAGPSTSGRDLRDLCEHAERRWASKIIRKEAAEGSLPPLQEYLASAAERLATIKQGAPPPRHVHPFSFLPPR